MQKSAFKALQNHLVKIGVNLITLSVDRLYRFPSIYYQCLSL